MKYLTLFTIFTIFLGCQTILKGDVLLEKGKCHIFGHTVIDTYSVLVLYPNSEFVEYFGSGIGSLPPNVSDRGTWSIDNNHIILNWTQSKKETLLLFTCEGEDYLLDLDLLELEFGKEIPSDFHLCDLNLRFITHRLKNYKICLNTEAAPVYLEICEKCRK